MRNLKTLLERFSQSLFKDTNTKEAIINIVRIHTNITLSPERITLKDGVLIIEASPVFKNEMKLKEEAIKTNLKEAHQISVQRILYK